MATRGAVERITPFLADIGILVVTKPQRGPTFLPAMTIRNGALVFDPETLVWPGDLLHEAGHIAVTHPDLRPDLNQISDDGGEEMAAIAWSYAAACAIGLAPEILFHEHGYRGGGRWLAESFAAGRYIGVTMLHWFGMATEARSGERSDGTCYPQMLRWLR